MTKSKFNIYEKSILTMLAVCTLILFIDLFILLMTGIPLFTLSSGHTFAKVVVLVILSYLQAFYIFVKSGQ